MSTGTVEGEFIATMDDPDDPEMFERNRIHTNAGAQEYGFQGAFVGGVTLYAWCVPTVIEALGEEWLDHGWVNIRFRRPTYPGARIRVRVRPKEDSPACVLEACQDDGQASIVGEVGLGTAPWLGDLRETPFSAPDLDGPALGGPALGGPDLDGTDRPFLTLENAPIGQPLRTYGYGQHTPAPPAVGQKLAEVIEDVVPPGVINIVTGPGAEIGKALAANPRIAKISFTGETVTGRLIMQYAAQNLIPSTVELGGKSPNIFFNDVMAHDDEFLDKAVEGLVLYAFNKGEVCTCPSRALIQADIYDEFMARCLDRIGKIKQGNPLDTATMLGPQVSAQQIEKIASYVEIGKNEGAEVLIGGNRASVDAEFAGGYYFEPTVLRGNNKMRVFQEEIFGPVLAVTTFEDEADALAIANDTLYGLGAGVWTRDGTLAYKMGRGLKAGRVWTNCYHQYPAGAAFGGYKISGIGRENHLMMLDHYSQTKNLLVSYSVKPLGLF